MAKRSQKKLYDAQVSAEAKKAGISKSEARSKIAKARERSLLLSEPPEQMAKRSQKKLYDAQVSAEAKKAGISKSEGSPHERCGAAGCE
jgi:hypothetical protein